MGDTPSNYNIPNGRVKVIEKPVPGKFESESKEKIFTDIWQTSVKLKFKYQKKVKSKVIV